MNQKAFSKLICFTKLLQNKKKQRFRDLATKWLLKEQLSEKTFLPRKKKCKVVKWRCWKQAINHQQYWVWLLCKIQAWQGVLRYICGENYHCHLLLQGQIKQVLVLDQNSHLASTRRVHPVRRILSVSREHFNV